MKFGKHKHYRTALECQRLNTKNCYYIKKEITKEEWCRIKEYNDIINYSLSGKRYKDLMDKINNRWNEPLTMKAIFNSLFYPLDEDSLKHEIKQEIKKNLKLKQMYIKRALGYISFEDYIIFFRAD